MFITARSFPTTQRLHSLKFTLVNKSHSQHSAVVVRCEGRRFLILYACALEVLFPGQIPRSLAWERHWCISKIASSLRARLARSLPALASQTQPIPAQIAFSMILKAIRAGVGWVWLARLGLFRSSGQGL